MLKYLFKAALKDGTIIEQTQEDKSSLMEGKNCFYDVLQRMDEVAAFGVYNQEDGTEYVVDLSDGRFEVDGKPFFMHNEPVSNIRLIWYRRSYITTNLIETPVYDYAYNFGFQALDVNGKNVQYVMTLR